MRFVLVGPRIEENLSLSYLAASLRRAGHEAELVTFARDAEHADAARRALAARPDAVGLSMAFQNRSRGFLALAADLRAAGFRGHVTAGGHWASLAADEILRDDQGIDSILQGEAEDSVVALAAALGGAADPAAVPGIVLRRDGETLHGPRPAKPDLASLPLPARDGPPLLHLGVPSAPLVASRGCRARCSFCSIAAFHRLSSGPVRRVRAPEQVAEEMAALWRERGARVFVFHDDDFFDGRPERDLDYVNRLGDAMAAHALPPAALVVKARPDDVDPDVFAALRRLGLVRVFLGVETDAPAGQRALARHLGPDANRRALALLGATGAFVCSNLLLWEPDTTLDDLRANLALMRDFQDVLFNLARTEPYEGAPLTARLAREGRLLGDYRSRDYLVADPRAELAWRVFVVALADRCYPLDGAINLAMGMAYSVRLLQRLFPSARAARLCEEGLALARRVAGSNRAWLEQVVEYAAVAPLGPAPEVLQFALDVGRAVRAEDSGLLAATRELLGRMERCAKGLPEDGALRSQEDAPPRNRVARGAASVALAAAGLLSCAKGKGAGDGASGPPPIAAAVPDADATSPEAPSDSAVLDAASVPADEETAGPAPADAATAPGADAANVAADADEVPDAANVAAPGDAAADDDSATREGGVTPAAESESLSIRATAIGWNESSGWRQQQCTGAPRVEKFSLRVRLAAADVAAVFDRFEATDGVVERVQPSDDGREARARWIAGKEHGLQRVTAIYRLTEEGAGTLVRSQSFFQYGDGQATAGPDEEPAPVCQEYMICDCAPIYPDNRPKSVPGGTAPPQSSLHLDLPLPLRYPVDVRCLADFGETLLLQADCPTEVATANPSFLWYASAGTIEPLEDRAQALWRPPDDGSPCVAVCAVQSVPLDLQLGTWRRG
ncbi:MAG: cobalamin B12-binding domain-containing protein [Deltaproteobacteria bacterium]|nr:cobalamin B12-binding domain-containing protein [Deltaproteobacteria bacterium]